MTFVNILTTTTTALSIVIHTTLIFLILRKDSKSWLNRSLALYLLSLLGLQLAGGTIVLRPDPNLSLLLYRSGIFLLPTPFLFYTFVQKLLKKKVPKWLVRGAALLYAPSVVLNFLLPGILIKDVVWSETAQFYLMVPNVAGVISALPFFLLPFFVAAFNLLRAYRYSKSAIERNRYKHLFLGILLIPIGFIAVLLPPLRSYPVDMVVMSISVTLFAYTILKYQLLDITVIIRKGLLYSILTAAVTGIYLFFSLLLQLIFQRAEVPISIPAIVSTALVVALVFQPLQNATQKFIDKVFFRRKYDPQKFVSHLSEACASTLDLKMLTESLVNSVLETLQVGKAGLFLVKRGTNRLHLAFSKGLEEEAKQIVFTTDRPLAQFLNQSDDVRLVYDLREKKIPLEELDQQGLELFVPLRSREKLRGVLALGPKLSEELYSLEELNLLQTVADPAALALENAQLFTQIKEEKERVEKLLESER